MPATAAPVSYTVSGDQRFTLVGVRATFDGTGAGGPFLPCVQILSPAGHVLSQTIGLAVAAGASADVSFFPLRRGTTTAGATKTLDQLISASSPDAWWKLNETSGTVAHDSSGNGHDAPTTAGQSTATWAAAVSPVGQVAAHFHTSGTATEFSIPAYPSLGATFTAGGWINRDTNLHQDFIGQNWPVHAGQDGWKLGVEAFNEGALNKAILSFGDGAATFTVIPSDVDITPGQWYSIACRRAGGVFTLWVNGVKQSTSSAAAFTADSGVLLGFDGSSFGLTGYGSYWMTWGRALSDSDMASVFGPL